MTINRTPRRWILTLALCFGLTALTAGPVQAAPARIRIIDLGTLGGTFSDSIAINDRGQVAGRSTTASGQFRSFIWQRGKMTDLGTLAGGDVLATAMNNRGEVVGSAFNGPNGQHSQAFLWRRGVLRTLGTLGGDSATAMDINDRGQVVGESRTSDGSTHGFLWDKGVMTDLGTLGGPFSSAAVINERGQVGGSSDTATSRHRHGFVWERGRMTDFGQSNLRNDDVSPVAINRRGQVVTYHDLDFQGDRGWTGFWDGRTLADIGGLVFGVTAVLAFPVYPNQALNDRGQIVGWSNVATSEDEGGVHAFLWQGGEMQDLGTLGGLSSQATAINNSGVVAGLSQTSQAGGSHAFLWRKGVMTDIGTLGGGSPQPVAINERGDVVGSDSGSEGQHAVLWTTSRKIAG